MTLWFLVLSLIGSFAQGVSHRQVSDRLHAEFSDHRLASALFNQTLAILSDPGGGVRPLLVIESAPGLASEIMEGYSRASGLPHLFLDLVNFQEVDAPGDSSLLREVAGFLERTPGPAHIAFRIHPAKAYSVRYKQTEQFRLLNVLIDGRIFRLDDWTYRLEGVSFLFFMDANEFGVPVEDFRFAAEVARSLQIHVSGKVLPEFVSRIRQAVVVKPGCTAALGGDHLPEES